jgi:hypothetical protein
MTHAAAFWFSLAMLAAAANAALSADLPGCVDGHPAKRMPDCKVALVPGCINYGGLLPLHGYQRDHYISLGLLGPDTPGNVHYQRLGMALVKDVSERKAVEWYCSGIMAVEDAQRWVAERWPVDVAHGYDRELP